MSGSERSLGCTQASRTRLATSSGTESPALHSSASPIRLLRASVQHMATSVNRAAIDGDVAASVDLLAIGDGPLRTSSATRIVTFQCWPIFCSIRSNRRCFQEGLCSPGQSPARSADHAGKALRRCLLLCRSLQRCACRFTHQNVSRATKKGLSYFLPVQLALITLDRGLERHDLEHDDSRLVRARTDRPIGTEMP